MIVTAQTAGSFLHSLFKTHALLYFIKVITSLLCKSLFQFRSSARQIIIRDRTRNIHVNRNFMVEAEVGIYIGCCNLAGCDSIDNCRWTRYAVSTCISAYYIGNDTALLCLNVSTEYRDSIVLEEANICCLSDCRDNNIARDFFFRLRRICRLRSP